jgi:hypothetical protein
MKKFPKYENNGCGHAYNKIKKKIVGNGGRCDKMQDVVSRCT